MTRVFVYEYATATTAADTSAAVASLRAEGRAMLRAVVEDFARVPGVSVLTVVPPGDAAADLPPGTAWAAAEEAAAFRTLAAEADYTLVIAPEFEERILSTRCRWVEEAGGTLLGPWSHVTEIVSDKLSVRRVWSAAGIPVPDAVAASQLPAGGTPPWHGTALGKPRRGAGAIGVGPWRPEWAGRKDYFAQVWCPGDPASIALIFDTSGRATALPPAWQYVDPGQTFEYRGGVVPLPHHAAVRAERLAHRIAAISPALRGFVGIDLILGDAADGSEDYAIEINPRLTTSYLGLRRLCEDNLAAAMLRAARGERVGPLRWKPGRVEFDPDGTVREFPA